MKKQLTIRIATALAVASSVLFSGCDQQPKAENSLSNTGRFGSEPASPGEDIWSNKEGHEDFYVAEKSGQVFKLVQCQSNRNLYVAWKISGATNGSRRT